MTGEALAQVADGGEKSIGMVTLILGPGVDFLSLLPSPALHHAANHIELPSPMPDSDLRDLTLAFTKRDSVRIDGGVPACGSRAGHRHGDHDAKEPEKGSLPPLLWLRALTTTLNRR